MGPDILLYVPDLKQILKGTDFNGRVTCLRDSSV